MATRLRCHRGFRTASLFGVTILTSLVALATDFKQPGFSESVVFTGLVNPMAVRFLPDGSILVAEKSGLIRKFDSLTDTTPTTVSFMRTRVHNFWDRGMLGFAVPPGFSPTAPDLWRRYVYVLYAHDALIGGTAPKWGVPAAVSDPCPGPSDTPPGPGATTDGCVISGRLSRLLATGPDWGLNEEVLIEDWCQQFPSHSVGALSFGADEKLYVSAGDGASFTNADWGQYGGTVGSPPYTPRNPCGDPPVPVGGSQVKPTAEGGALRSQSPRRPAGEPRVLGGTILRVDPATGAAVPGNPLFGSSDANERRIIGYGLRNPFRTIVKPGTNEVWIADVGWGAWEEINRIPDLASARNFGWPCFEGNGPMYSGLNICPTQAQTTAPVYTYHHNESVVANDGCTVGSSSIAGMAFYGGASNYPAGYSGGLFFSDYSRKCVWIMFAGSNGIPDPNTRAAFAANAKGPVDLQIGPGGDLYYVDFDGGRLVRVKFGLSAVAVATTPTSGNVPLTVGFDGTGSVPAQAGTILTFAWDLDGDGQYDDSSASKPSFVYTTAGTYTVRLKVTDPGGGFDISDPITVNAGNAPPTATILTPAASLTWKVNDVVSFSGQGTDPEDGTLPPSRMSWSIIINHCPSNCHTHAYQSFSGVASGTFTAPDHEYPSFLEVRLTVTDSGGLSRTSSVNINPKTVNLTMQSAPTGLQLTIGSTTQAAPYTRTVIVGSLNGIAAPSPQGSNQFASWSDGGAQNHNITAPATAATYTATYTAGGLPAPWTSQDIGSVGVAGSATHAGGVFTVKGSGADIWGNGDEFRYVLQPRSGDVTIVAKVASVQNTHDKAKAGVMIRETLTAGSRNAMVAATPGTGLQFQRRVDTGHKSSKDDGPNASAPYWVKLKRTGNTFEGYTSPDGVTWTLIRSRTISMTSSVYVGLAVTSHNDAALNTSTFSNVTVTSP